MCHVTHYYKPKKERLNFRDSKKCASVDPKQWIVHLAVEAQDSLVLSREWIPVVVPT